VQGPAARARLGAAVPRLAEALGALRPFSAVTCDAWFVGRTGYTGEDGFEIALAAPEAADLWRALQAQAVVPCGLGARDTLRLEAGMNLYGGDMDQSVTPFESGLAWTVDLRAPRPFVGRAALERQQAGPPLRQLLGLRLLGRGVLRAHQQVATAHGAGEITSGTFAPTVGGSIALARLPAGVAPGDEVTVELRSGPAPARVCRPPFVRNGKVLA
jgi:aminomethyltransferase